MNTKAVEPKTKLKIHVNKSLAIEPPELAGFYVDSVDRRRLWCPWPVGFASYGGS